MHLNETCGRTAALFRDRLFIHEATLAVADLKATAMTQFGVVALRFVYLMFDVDVFVLIFIVKCTSVYLKMCNI